MEKFLVHYKDMNVPDKIGEYLKEHMKGRTAIVCIGTDKCIIDCLGPLTGTFLLEKNISADVYGTLTDPVHALNIHRIVKLIDKKKYDTVIALDACLTSSKKIGDIEIASGSIFPGKAIGKNLPKVGDISIIGVMEEVEIDFKLLMNIVRLSFVYEMAQILSSGIVLAEEKVKKNKLA
jgi:putative sporulation protein YyaC